MEDYGWRAGSGDSIVDSSACAFVKTLVFNERMRQGEGQGRAKEDKDSLCKGRGRAGCGATEK